MRSWKRGRGYFLLCCPPTRKIIKSHAGNVVRCIACSRVGILLNPNETFREFLRATIYAKQIFMWRIEVTDQAGSLHDRLNRISHWDVNVTDLERSRSWYEATTTLRVVARTKASQSFPGFGIVVLGILPDPVSGRSKDAGWQQLGGVSP